MDTGLAKLEEASCSVEILKKDLAVMEQELAQASEKAENVCFTELYFLCVYSSICNFSHSPSYTLDYFQKSTLAKTFAT
jgi:hypothetical protein